MNQTYFVEYRRPRAQRTQIHLIQADKHVKLYTFTHKLVPHSEIKREKLPRHQRIYVISVKQSFTKKLKARLHPLFEKKKSSAGTKNSTASLQFRLTHTSGDRAFSPASTHTHTIFNLQGNSSTPFPAAKKRHFPSTFVPLLTKHDDHTSMTKD
jgi:hypothetical protein